VIYSISGKYAYMVMLIYMLC